MSLNSPTVQKRVAQASGIVAAAEGKVRITDAMQMVGFATPERRK
jgi:hypothetical protein